VVHDLRRMVELAGDKLVLETAGGFKALDAATGKQLWRHEVSGVLHGQLCGTTGGLLYACRERANAESWRPCLVWLDTDTGAPLGRSPLANLADKTPYLGPLVSDGTRLWAFSGRGREPKREILELVRRDSPSPRTAPPPLVAEWSSHLDSQLADAARSVLTGWTLVTCEYDKKTRLIDEWHGERNVLVTLSSARKPVRLARELALPAGTPARLRMKVGLEGDSRFRIDVRVGGDSLLSQTIEPGKTENGWKELEVDLSRYAGGRHWLTVVQRDLGKQPGYAYWKGLEVVEGPVSKHN